MAREPCHLVQLTARACEGLSVELRALQSHIISHMLEKVRQVCNKCAVPSKTRLLHQFDKLTALACYLFGWPGELVSKGQPEHAQ